MAKIIVKKKKDIDWKPNIFFTAAKQWKNLKDVFIF